MPEECEKAHCLHVILAPESVTRAVIRIVHFRNVHRIHVMDPTAVEDPMDAARLFFARIQC